MCFVALFGMTATKLSAQLSGVYTINSAVATGGTNFQTFSAFAAVINTAGISAPVTVNVAPGSGPYVEQVNFTQIAGTSATNTIAINGNSTTITFNATVAGSPYTFNLNGTDYMTVNDLNMIGTGPTYALVCHLYNQANNNRFNNCSFTAPANGTSLTHAPVSLSGSGTSATASGNSGSNNVWSACTMNNGYYSTVLAGSTSSPFNTGNQVLNCNVKDFYLYGIYNLYCQGSTASGNTVERPNRTNSSTAYGIYFSTGSVANGLIEKNRIQRLYDATQGLSNSAYCIYIGASATAGNENVIRNNVVSNINFTNGLIYAIYAPGYNYLNIYHNTVSLDDATSTAGTTYGIMASGSAAINVKNNLVNITRGGTGTKYCLYYSSINVSSNNNILYINSPAGTNAIGYYLTAYNTMNAWKGVNGGLWDQASVNADPVFTNPAAFNYLPTSATVNNVGTQLGIADDIMAVTRYSVSPDAGAFEFFNTVCNTTPSPNAIVAPTIIACPSSSTALSLANNYTVNGITYQWSIATNSVGPYTPVANGTLMAFSTPTLANTSWFQVTLGCVNGGGTVVSLPGQVQIATTVTNSVPYFEDFEGIYGPNKLPNCSWAASNLGITCQTYDSPNNSNRIPYSGNKFASFYYTPAGTNYFYTNGIQLYAGVTYSASVWFTTEYQTYNTYNLSIMVGPNQTTTGLVPVANLAVAASPNYKNLSNTFTVATSGIYYVAIRGISNGVCCGNYLSWDDLSITIPCELNVPGLSVSGTSVTTLCAGQPVNLSASGADTYSWSTGATTSTIAANPQANVSYAVVGTNTASGCSTSVVKNFIVNPAPQVSVFVFDPNVCEGSPISLNGVGASTYTWSTGDNGSILTATPTTTGSVSYMVTGANQYGCTGTATQVVNVNPLPNVGASSSPSVSCAGDAVMLNGSGAANYQWMSNNLFVSGSQVIVTPNANTTYTVTGTDANGCSKMATVSHGVEACVGVKELSKSLQGLSIYPNPNNGSFTVELSNTLSKTIEVTDVTGRSIVTYTSTSDIIPVNIGSLANGIYYVKVTSDTASEVLKVVKQ